MYHFDFYRFEDRSEWVDSGFREYFNQDSACIVEWPERAAGLLAPPDLEVRLEFSGSGRRARLTPRTACGRDWLATADYGTALAVLFAAQEQGKAIAAFADETRPLLQGARLTSWELKQAGIPVTLICDSMAAQVMREGRVTAIIVGADRIAANGDVANKIGTYGLSVLAKEHGVPFYVAAPASTFDLSIESGDDIPIEQRDPAEVTRWGGRQIAPDGVDVYNPAFDVTPAANVTAIITEKGVIHAPDKDKIASLLGGE